MIRGPPQGERARAERFTAEVSLRLSGEVRRLLRALLAACLERDLPFEILPRAKPALPRPDPIHFNIAHTDVLIVLGFSFEAPPRYRYRATGSGLPPSALLLESCSPHIGAADLGLRPPHERLVLTSAS
jgi:hypothetical protein